MSMSILPENSNSLNSIIALPSEIFRKKEIETLYDEDQLDCLVTFIYH